jgi:microcin C transport system permease protein
MRWKINPITARKLKRFRSIRRGYWSFLLLGGALLVSLFGELLVNDQALVVRHNGHWYFPAVADTYPIKWIYTPKEPRTGKFFGEAKDEAGQTYSGLVNYRSLKKTWKTAERESWLIMPLIPHGPDGNTFSEGVKKLSAPSREHKHYLGTDGAGRDIAARMFYGFRIVMLFALGFTLMVFFIGSTVGCLMGYFGGKVDLLGLRLVEIWANIPFLYMVMIMVSVVPSKVGMTTRVLLLLFIMVVFSWTSMTYYMRASTYKEKARDYVAAAQLLGAGPLRIVFTHLLPNTVSTLVTFLPFTVAVAISSVTALDFLNFGLPEGTPSWGHQLRLGQEYIREKPWIIGSALTAIFLVLTMVTFIGEAVREAFDPKKFSTYE